MQTEPQSWKRSTDQMSFFEQISGRTKGSHILNEKEVIELKDTKVRILKAKDSGEIEINLPQSTSIGVVNWLRNDGFDVIWKAEEINEWCHNCQMSDAWDNEPCYQNCPRRKIKNVLTVRWS